MLDNRSFRITEDDVDELRDHTRDELRLFLMLAVSFFTSPLIKCPRTRAIGLAMKTNPLAVVRQLHRLW